MITSRQSLKDLDFQSLQQVVFAEMQNTSSKGFVTNVENMNS